MSERRCPLCRAALERAPGERSYAFAKRRHCSVECASRSRAKTRRAAEGKAGGPRLTPDDVRAIRAQLETRHPRDIAPAFGVSVNTIYQIRLGYTWKDVV